MTEDIATRLETIADDKALLEIARRAIEDLAVEWRDAGMSEIRGNGIAIRYADGKPSNTIRFGPETAMRHGLRAIAQALKTNETSAATVAEESN